MLSLTFILITLAISAGLLIVNLRHAPEGFQDENGFHFKNKAEEVEFCYYNAFAHQQPKQYPAKIAGHRHAA